MALVKAKLDSEQPEPVFAGIGCGADSHGQTIVTVGFCSAKDANKRLVEVQFVEEEWREIVAKVEKMLERYNEFMVDIAPPEKKL